MKEEKEVKPDRWAVTAATAWVAGLLTVFFFRFQLDPAAEGLITEKVCQPHKVTGNLIFGDVTHAVICHKEDRRPIPPRPHVHWLF